MSSRRQLANAIRFLSVDAVQRAKSGHPGAPMGMADIAEVLWNDYLSHNPANPNWWNRDRFVLSNGHGSMLAYSLLHLSGYDVSMDDIKNFRQLHSKTPGHPELGYTPGIETTTGPLGQGLANGVGMALAEKVLAAKYNRRGLPVVDHYTYVFAGDGCLMEGISHEVCSLAGTQALGKLIVFYDANQISIDGDISGWFTDDTAKRFQAYGWQVIKKVDGHNSGEIRSAIEVARADADRPTLIICQTQIGYGSPNKAGSASTHGAPLGEEEIVAMRDALDWEYDPFVVPEEVYEGWSAVQRGGSAEAEWQTVFTTYQEGYPALAEELQRRMSGELPVQLASIADAHIQKSQSDMVSVATRKASQMALQAMAGELPELLGGSADLSGSNCTSWSGAEVITADLPDGNYLNYGVREFGMAAIMNGLSLHGGFIPYAGTFLIFMEYARNALRMAALMKQGCIYVFTHDSIGVGEDGPTHQPIEQLTALRSTPNLDTWRPCDTVEAGVAWKSALMRRDGPTAFALTRQGLPCQARDAEQLANIEKGGYLLGKVYPQPDAIIIATGSEVSLALDAQSLLEAGGASVNVVSMPCSERFDAQPQAYRDLVLPPALRARVAVEAGHKDFWYKYVGLDGVVIGMDRFGESAPAAQLFQEFGITTQAVVDAVLSIASV